MKAIRRLRSRANPIPLHHHPPGYRVFTTEFDEILHARNLVDALFIEGAEKRYEYERLKAQFLKSFALERLALVEKSTQLIRGLVSRYSREDRQKMVVSVLIDHSNSMRGNRIVSACIATENIISTLEQCGIRSEAIGFTTRSWKGGRSREKWFDNKKPRDPGRLCDLRYVLYREATDTHPVPPKFTEALYPDLLKENLDGEALEFAVGRLLAENWERRIVVVISDGAPVDDSTLFSNTNKRLLTDHLNEVEKRVQTEGIILGHVLLSEQAYRPELLTFEYGYEPISTGEALIKVLWDLLDVHFVQHDNPHSSST